MITFGEWLRKNRKAAGLSQDKLAEKASAYGTSITSGAPDLNISIALMIAIPSLKCVHNAVASSSTILVL